MEMPAHKTSFVLFLTSALLVIFCSATNLKARDQSLNVDAAFPQISGPYLGQTPPGRLPEVFAPGIISSERDEHSTISLSLDGSEILYTDVSLKSYPVVMHTRLVDGFWTKPCIASFSGIHWDDGVTFSPDGSRLYLTTRRPLQEGSPPPTDSDVWYLVKENDKWTKPRRLEGAINSSSDDGGLSFAEDGTVYFSSYRPGGPGDCNIYRCRLIEGEGSQPQILDDSINIGVSNFAPCIDPNGSYLIFGCMVDEETGIGLYVSFRTPGGAWSRAKRMGQTFNPSFISWFPGLSPDGKYLFYCGLNPDGNLDIYWVSVEAIENLRPKND